MHWASMVTEAGNRIIGDKNISFSLPDWHPLTRKTSVSRSQKNYFPLPLVTTASHNPVSVDSCHVKQP